VFLTVVQVELQCFGLQMMGDESIIYFLLTKGYIYCLYTYTYTHTQVLLIMLMSKLYLEPLPDDE